ncbi:MAG: hypothetical protein K5657_02970 [Desulfovibrio sp.]|nr:hypothetical protein [Desulfovibrio sp.]
MSSKKSCAAPFSKNYVLKYISYIGSAHRRVKDLYEIIFKIFFFTKKTRPYKEELRTAPFCPRGTDENPPL